MTAVPLDPDDVDDVDGAAISSIRAGERLPGGALAWERLGVGHRCETWLGWSETLWTPVVVKFPRPEQLGRPRARAALRREVAALAGNRHPALPELYDDGTDDALPYLVFEHVDGLALDEEIEEHGAFAALDAALLGIQVLAGLRRVHARRLAHVDIKPDNIVLRDGRPVLLDFGSARPIGAEQPEGSLIGSAGYAAPDLEAGAPISAAMDLYGLGATLYEALAGTAAFSPDLPAGDRQPPAALDRSPMADVVNALLDPDPAQRPGVDTTLRRLGDISADAGRSAWPPWARL
jgi:serine/threonine protein kinase